MPSTSIVMVLVWISVVGAIAIPFGDPQFLDRAIALELSFITLCYCYSFWRHVDCKGNTTCKICAMCLHTNCYHCNGGKLACIASHWDYDNVLKTTQCCIANNWWLCLTSSTYWYNYFALCKDAQSHCSKRKELDDRQKDLLAQSHIHMIPLYLATSPMWLWRVCGYRSSWQYPGCLAIRLICKILFVCPKNTSQRRRCFSDILSGL